MPVSDSKATSARKSFQVMRIKTTLMQSLALDDDAADAKLAELEKSLTKTFGKAEANEILEAAIAAADEQFMSSMSALAQGRAAQAKEE